MRRPALAAALALAVAVAGAAGAEAAPKRLYVKSGAAAGGDGSKGRPFDSLAAVERASGPGDRIVVLPSPRGMPPLDGGIALQPRQSLVGAGNPVVAPTARAHSRLHSRLRRRHRKGHRGLRGREGVNRRRAHRRLHRRLKRAHRLGHPRDGTAPRITNTTGDRHAGDAVVLSDGAVVENLVIERAFRGAVYGLDAGDVVIRGNDVSGHNGSCTPGFHIGPFEAPTLTGFNLPAPLELDNGWAGIMVDAGQGSARVRIEGNRVHDAHCGDGIDVRAYGTADVRAQIEDNLLERLEQGENLQSILAIGLQTRDTAKLDAVERRNRVHDIGSADADSEGMFAELKGASRMDVLIEDAIYTNPRGIGGFSSNGMEFIITSGSGIGNMAIRNSSFTGPPGDVLEEGNLGTGARMSMTLDNVVAARSTGTDNPVQHGIPFNRGDCLVGGNGGGGDNEFSLRIVDSELSDCANNGLSVLNGAHGGSSVNVQIERSRITGNRAINLWLGNTGRLDRLAFSVEDSALCNSQGTNVQIENRGTAPAGGVDLGGGPLGSAGRNDLSGGTTQAVVADYGVSARNNWWGQPGGPAIGSTVVAGSLDSAPALDQKPALAC